MIACVLSGITSVPKDKKKLAMCQNEKVGFGCFFSCLKEKKIDRKKEKAINESTGKGG